MISLFFSGKILRIWLVERVTTRQFYGTPCAVRFFAKLKNRHPTPSVNCSVNAGNEQKKSAGWNPVFLGVRKIKNTTCVGISIGRGSTKGLSVGNKYGINSSTLAEKLYKNPSS